MRHKGFTMIELMLAMGFLATLLITIALLVNMIVGIYQKGLSLRAVNATGKQLVDDFSRIIGGSPIPPDPNPKDLNGDHIIKADEIDAALRQYFFIKTRTDAEGKQYQTSGVFCTGSFSYIWNTQPTFEANRKGDTSSINFADLLLIKFGSETKAYRMARVRDAGREICGKIATGALPGGVIEVATKPLELINGDEADLILYDFTIFPATQHNLTHQTFYSGTFILGTMTGGINIMSNGDYCDVQSGSAQSLTGLSHTFNYCAVNKFNFAMRATGETKYGTGKE